MKLLLVGINLPPIVNDAFILLLSAEWVCDCRIKTPIEQKRTDH